MSLSDAQRTQFIKQSGQAAQGELTDLINTGTFKNATPEQQSKMMSDVVSGQRELAKQSFGSTSKMDSAGKAAQQGRLPTVNSSGKVTTTAAETPQQKYQDALAKWQKGVENGTLDVVQAAVEGNKLVREGVTSNYPKDVTDLYGQSAKKIEGYFATHNDPALKSQIELLDSQLVSAGIISKSKFSSTSNKIGGSTTVKGTRIKRLPSTSSLLRTGFKLNKSASNPSYLRAKAIKATKVKAVKFTNKAPKLPSMKGSALKIKKGIHA